MKQFTAITLFLLIALMLLPAGYVSAQEPIPPAPPLTPTLISSPFGEETEVEVDITNLEPLIACPPSPTNVKPVREVAGRRVDSVFIGSCTNGRFEDFAAVAEVVRAPG